MSRNTDKNYRKSWTIGISSIMGVESRESMISSCFPFSCVVTSSHWRCAMACNPGKAGGVEGSVQYGDCVGPGRRPTLSPVQ